MRILFLGDVMGRSGRDGVAARLPELKSRFDPDVLIVNVENAAAGFGVTLKLAEGFFALGADCLTTGNHVWDQKELLGNIGGESRLLRPVNYPEGTAGSGAYLHKLADGRRILIANIMGRRHMEPSLDDPFVAAEKLLEEHRLGETVQAIFIDFHAEATSEKMTFAHFLDGRVSSVVGTHTHIPTADAHVLPRGTAYQTDAGMCGDYDSVIGMKKEVPIWKLTKKTPTERMTPAEGEATVCGVFITTDDATGLATGIDAVMVGGVLGRESL